VHFVGLFLSSLLKMHGPKKKRWIVFCFVLLSKARHETSSMQVCLYVSTLRFVFLFAGRSVGNMFHPQRWWNSCCCRTCLQFPRSQHKLHNDSYFSVAFSFVLPVSSRRISWQAVLLMFSSYENIRTVIYDYVSKILGFAQCSRQCTWWMDGRISHHLCCLPSFKKACMPFKHTHTW